VPLRTTANSQLRYRFAQIAFTVATATSAIRKTLGEIGQ